MTTAPPNSTSPTTTPLSFDALKLSLAVRRAVQDAGYTRPTDVQAAVFGPISTGKDTIVQSKTGSGKTAAFALPLIDRVVEPARGVQVLVLCPTRELALQVSGEFARLGRLKGVVPCAIYGGASLEKQVDEIRAGAHVIVGTPGRVLDHLKRGTFDPSELKTVCLDEADEMLSMGFAEELNAILERLPKTRQTLLFSATMPEAIRRMANRHQKDPESILLSADQISPDSIDHFLYFVGSQDRVTALARVLELESPDRAIIFCNTRDETQSVATALQRRGFSLDYLSGELEQSARERVLAAFREHKIQHLVATDVAARGIDVTDVTHVVNFGFPSEAETYVHRTGRTGRAGKRGVAVSLFGPADVGSVYMLRLTYGIRPIERALPSAAEERTRRELERLAALRVESNVTLDDDTAALARRIVAHDDAERMVGYLVKKFLHQATSDALEKSAPKEERVVAAKAPSSAPTEPPPSEEPAVEVAKTVAAEEPAPARRPRSRSAQEKPRRIDVHGGADPGLEPETFESDMGEVRVAVGRRDGARGGDLARLIRDKAGIAPKDIGSIKIYDRFAIVPVRAESVDAVIAALEDATFNDQPLSPERGKLNEPSLVPPASSEEE
ncbi:MAG: DEAD/DEAH box helicase [Myxococcales bacterium]|nr:DEAD/DEAH box helicase [Myxococcales bacterium]